MRRIAFIVLLGAGLSALALAQAPSLSNHIPDGLVPGAGEAPGGDGCPCTVGAPEGEANCGVPTDTVNGGCNSAPNVFGAIAPGGQVCGTADWNFTTPGTRDTDWYLFTVTIGGTYTWRVEAEFPAQLAIIDAAAGCAAPVSLGDDFTTGCGDSGAVSVDLAPGTYWAFVAPDFSGPTLACGAEYSASLLGQVPIQAIPTLSRVGLVAAGLVLAGLAFFLLRRRRTATS